MKRPILKLNFRPGYRDTSIGEALTLGLVEVMPHPDKMDRANRYARRKGRK